MSIRINTEGNFKSGSLFGNGSSSSFGSGNFGVNDFMGELAGAVKSQDPSGSNSFFGGLGSLFNKAVSFWDDYVGNTANRENIAYQKEYNQQVFDRADTQYQRTVSDLRAAGLSSQLAAGAPSTVAGQSAAPQRIVGNESQAMERLIGMISSMKQVNANAALAAAQVDKTKAETASIEAQNATYGERHALDMILKRSQADYNSKLTQIAMIEGQYKASEIESRINNTLADTKYKNSLISLAEKQSALYNAQTVEAGVKSYYYQAQIEESEKRSENLEADTALKNATKSKIRQETLNLEQQKKNLIQDFELKVKQGLHLDAQTDLLLKQAVNAALETTILQYNYDTSYRNGLRTTDVMPNGLFGTMSIPYTMGNYLNNVIQNFK